MMVNPGDEHHYENGVSNHFQTNHKIDYIAETHKILLGFDNPQTKGILKMVNDINIVRIFASVTEPMTVKDICKKTKVSKTTLYRKISELEELRLLMRKGRSAKDTENLGTWVYEKSFESLKVNFQNPREALIVIIPKEEYFAKIARRLRN